MRNHKLKLMMLAAAAWSGAVLATEYRTQLITERGPLRYDLYEKQEKWSLDTNVIGHYRNAHKAYLKHGTDTVQLPALIFGKENFTFSEAFPNASINQQFTQFRNPFLATTVFTPRASYDEKGVTLGARFEYPVWNNKGRIGVRTAIPFKSVRMERDDAGEAELSSSLSAAVIRSDTVNMVDGAPRTKNFSSTTGGINFSRYKLSLLANLLRLGADGKVLPALQLAAGTSTTAAPSDILGAQYNRPTTEANLYQSNGLIGFVVMQSPQSGVPPIGQPTAASVDLKNIATSPSSATGTGIGDTQKAVWADAATGTGIRFGTPDANGAFSVVGTVANLQALPTDGSTKPGVGYVFVQDRDYTKLPLDDLWATPIFDSKNGGTKPEINDIATAAATGIPEIETELAAFQNLSVEEFLFLNGGGFQIATNQHTGLGDIDLDIFYEHTFGENLRGELMFGVRFPTGGSNEFCPNPFRMQLGNGNHFEIKLGANFGVAPCDWLTMKLEALWSFVLEDKEKRPAAFKGATIKNVGPCVDADVDWGYFTGRFDMTWYHPKNNDLALTTGYEFYYKTEDEVKFKQATSDTFLGPVLLGADNKPASATNAGTHFGSFPQPLDNKVAEKDTESLSHRFYGELNWRALEHMSLFCGGAFNFAGQNIFRIMDMHGGVQVRF